jgi:hypothetical protein
MELFVNLFSILLVTILTVRTQTSDRIHKESGSHFICSMIEKIKTLFSLNLCFLMFDKVTIIILLYFVVVNLVKDLRILKSKYI